MFNLSRGIGAFHLFFCFTFLIPLFLPCSFSLPVSFPFPLRALESRLDCALLVPICSLSLPVCVARFYVPSRFSTSSFSYSTFALLFALLSLLPRAFLRRKRFPFSFFTFLPFLFFTFIIIQISQSHFLKEDFLYYG